MGARLPRQAVWSGVNPVTRWDSFPHCGCAIETIVEGFRIHQNEYVETSTGPIIIESGRNDDDIMNCKGREEELDSRRSVQRRLMRALAQACAQQLERGDHFVRRGPQGSAMWR